MKIKVCGMRDPHNVAAIAALSPDYMGFIFYPKSKRYVGDNFNANELFKIPVSIKKVGVFVNSSYDEIVKKAQISTLDFLQLHGNETPELCAALQDLGYGIIKAFQIDEDFDFDSLQAYETCCNYFLFDTASKAYGGSGDQFNWDLLSKYKAKKGIFLSGGIDLDSIQQLSKLNVPIVALDINSRFEISPALKEVGKVSEFIYKINNNV